MTTVDVLLVEDDPIINWNVTKHLQRSGRYEVTSISTIGELLSKAAEYTYDIIITNLKLEDGWLTMKQLSAIAKSSDHTLVATGLNDPYFYDFSSPDIEVSVLNKPFSPHQLKRVLAEMSN